MFAVIYSFQVKPNQKEQFIDAWTKLTELIYEFEGSLGSRLHHEKGAHYIAYAQWPSREVWENFGNHMPPEAKTYSKAMKEACIKIETLHAIDAVSDLLKQKSKS